MPANDRIREFTLRRIDTKGEHCIIHVRDDRDKKQAFFLSLEHIVASPELQQIIREARVRDKLEIHFTLTNDPSDWLRINRLRRPQWAQRLQGIKHLTPAA